MNITPATIMRGYAEAVEASVEKLKPQVIIYCEKRMLEAACDFGRKKVVIENQDLHSEFEFGFDIEPIREIISHKFTEAGYKVDLSHESFVSISCEGAFNA